LGEFALLQGDYTRAATLLRGSWTLVRDLGYNVDIALGLTELDGVVAAQEGAEAAARLLGIVESLVDTLDAILTLRERSEWERHVAAARAHLDVAAFAAAWAEGAAMTLDQAIAEALAIGG
jgi:hypothetical protein